ncbi:MAG: CGNR zinc finger domain-containing protein [Ilumatobacteraceae bacterium]
MLDFVNTVSGRPVYSRDDLAEADDLFDWALAAGLLSNDDLVKPSGDRSSAFRSAIVLRENLYLAFTPLDLSEAQRVAALALVARRAAQATRSAQWVSNQSGYQAWWPQDTIESICDRLADEALRLLRSPLMSRVGSCAGCGWLFLDTSRAHARRWCSMNACGVRNKMRRYHQRQARESSTA